MILSIIRAPLFTWLLFVSTDGLAGIKKADAAVQVVHVSIMMFGFYVFYSGILAFVVLVATGNSVI